MFAICKRAVLAVEQGIPPYFTCKFNKMYKNLNNINIALDIY